MESLALGAITDVALIAGGARRALDAHGITSNTTTIIKRSPRLLALSGVTRESSAPISSRLGLPYADPGHFVVHQPREQRPEVSFAPETLAFIRNHMAEKSGCPAAAVTPEGSTVSILQAGWNDLVPLLVPPHATVNAHQ
ncbi:MAG TPA: hypothetical protein VMY99_04285 [Nevskiaceae bacterium]|nr:hypothetical protein [Nevskiaceae bacterium]